VSENSQEIRSGSEKNNKRSKRGVAFTAVCAAVLLALIAFISLSIIGCSARNKKKNAVDKGSVVLTVEGEKIYENQFRFFASLVLNQEGTVYTLLTEDNIDANATVKNSVVNFAKEYIFRLRECSASGLSLSSEEKQKVLDSIKNEYDQYKTVGDDTYEGDAFYDHYYGLTERQYTDFWLDWALIEKYNADAEANADVSEENQRAAYEHFENYLYGREITVLSLSAKGKTGSEMEVINTLARELKEQIVNGADMADLIRKHCDDEALKESNGKVVVTSIMKSSFPEIYSWAEEAEEGSIDVISDDKAVYIVKAGKKQEFEDLKNSENMLEWTRLYVVDRQIEELIGSGKYKYTVNEKVYDSIDLNELIDSCLKNWRSHYAELEAGDM
jgi:hypothetical protein